MVRSGDLSEDFIADTLAQLYGLPRAQSSDIENIQDLTQYGLNIEELRSLNCRPLSFKDGRLKIGIADPSNLSVVSTLKNKLHRPVEPYVITISELHPVGAVGRTSTTTASGDDPDEGIREGPAQPKSEVVRYVSDLIGNAIAQGVSDIHLEASRNGARARFRTDGVLSNYNPDEAKSRKQKENSFLRENYRAVVARVKIMANLDISERRQPQDGAIFFDEKGDGNGTDIRVSILPSQFGERVVMRILDKSAVQLDLDTLGFPEAIRQPFMQAIESPQGLILVTGPTGSGKTTTQYAALNHLNDPSVNILTVEDPIEYHLDGISQVQVKEEIQFTFAAILRSFLRQDPEILLVGEIRDLETVDIALKAALTGHLVLSTLHTNSSIGTIYRLINMGVEKYLISSAVSYILAQRLARRVCKHCAAEDVQGTENVKLFAKRHALDEFSDVKAMQGLGCEKCSHRGYSGRVGIYEGLKIDTDIQQAILDGIPEPKLLELAKAKGFRTMHEMALDRVKAGEISFEEFSRVVMVQ
jgi:type IV pilus assembly protein PilB